MHVSHALHMHEPGTDARIWSCDVWWAAPIGAAHICNIVWCICLSHTQDMAIWIWLVNYLHLHLHLQDTTECTHRLCPMAGALQEQHK